MDKSILNPFSINYKIKVILQTGSVGMINRGQLMVILGGLTPNTADSHLVNLRVILQSQYMTTARMFITLMITPKGLLSDISAL